VYLYFSIKNCSNILVVCSVSTLMASELAWLRSGVDLPCNIPLVYLSFNCYLCEQSFKVCLH